MSVQMIKHNGKWSPTKEVDGKLVPDDGKVLQYTEDGMKVVDKKDEENS